MATANGLTKGEYRKSFRIVSANIRQDPELRRAWRDAVSMAFQDEMHLAGYRLPDLAVIANLAADHFLVALLNRTRISRKG